jgi:hypothetical protein
LVVDQLQLVEFQSYLRAVVMMSSPLARSLLIELPVLQQLFQLQGADRNLYRI